MSGGAKELRRLCTLKRDRGDTEIRWSWDEFESDDGKSTKYGHARKWVKDADGEFHPTKAGVTIRLSELDQVVEALRRIQRARDGAASNSRPTHMHRRADERPIDTTGQALSPDEQLEVF